MIFETNVRLAKVVSLALTVLFGMSHLACGAAITLPEAAEHQADIVANIEVARTMCTTAAVEPRMLEQMYAGIQLASYRVLEPREVREYVLASFKRRIRDPEPPEGWCIWAERAFGPNGSLKRGALQNPR